MKKRITVLAVVFTFFISFSAQAFSISSIGACTVDFESGEYIYEKNADTALVPASLTKIMTLYVVYEKMSEGVLTKDTIITISSNAAYSSTHSDGSNIPLTAGQKMTVDEIIKAIALPSACACATAIAEHISGSEAKFAQLMNKKAAELGMSVYFVDASGLSPNNRVTPRSFAILVRNFISKYPDILNYTSKTSVTINGVTYKSTNKFLNAYDSNYYSIVDGFKTGTSTPAGYNLISTAKKDDTRIINVVMKAPSNQGRYSDSRALLDNGFSKVEQFKNNMFYTDIRTFINGEEIPCCYYGGNVSALCIIAEDLNKYGFDVSYDSDTTTLYISESKGKAMMPVIQEKTPQKEPIYKIFDHPWLRAVVVNDGTEYPLNTVYSLNGYCCISIDELGQYFSYNWDENQRIASLNY